MASPLQSVLAPGLGVPSWGIYTVAGAPSLVASSVNAFQYARDWKISSYPQEMGAFMSYNKVKTPYVAKVVYSLGGGLAFRAAFLAQAELVVASLDLVSVITPEIQYASANPTHLDYDRNQMGATLFKVAVWCEEVRVVVGAAASPTASVNGANPTQSGVVQPGPTLTSSPTGTVTGTATGASSSGTGSGAEGSATFLGPQSVITTTTFGSPDVPNQTIQSNGLAPPASQNITPPSDFYTPFFGM